MAFFISLSFLIPVLTPVLVLVLVPVLIPAFIRVVNVDSELNACFGVPNKDIPGHPLVEDGSIRKLTLFFV